MLATNDHLARKTLPSAHHLTLPVLPHHQGDPDPLSVRLLPRQHNSGHVDREGVQGAPLHLIASVQGAPLPLIATPPPTILLLRSGTRLGRVAELVLVLPGVPIVDPHCHLLWRVAVP